MATSRTCGSLTSLPRGCVRVGVSKLVGTRQHASQRDTSIAAIVMACNFSQGSDSLCIGKIPDAAIVAAALTERQPKSLQIVRTHWRQAGLTLRSLNIYTPTQSLHLCRDLSMSLQAGNSLLLVGPSGCGKSSMLRAIAGTLSHPAHLLKLTAIFHDINNLS